MSNEVLQKYNPSLLMIVIGSHVIINAHLTISSNSCTYKSNVDYLAIGWAF